MCFYGFLCSTDCSDTDVDTPPFDEHQAMAWCWTWMEDPRVDGTTRTRINGEIGVGIEPDVRVRHRLFREVCAANKAPVQTASGSQGSSEPASMILSRFITERELGGLLRYPYTISNIRDRDRKETPRMLYSYAMICNSRNVVFAVVEQADGGGATPTDGMDALTAGLQLGHENLVKHRDKVARITYRVKVEAVRAPHSLDANGWPSFCPTGKDERFGRTRDLRDDARRLAEVVTGPVPASEILSLESVSPGAESTPTPQELQWIRSRQDRWRNRRLLE